MIDIYGIIFIIIFGTLSHFIYEWSNHNKIVAIFCAINESIWEHIKITCIPLIIWMLLEIPFLKTNNNFLFAKAVSLLFIPIIMIIGYYGRKLFINKDSLIYDIGLFIFTIIVSQFVSYKILMLNTYSVVINNISLVIIILFIFCLLTFSFYPLKNELFKDPLVNDYGLKAHKKYDKIKNTKK